MKTTNSQQLTNYLCKHRIEALGIALIIIATLLTIRSNNGFGIIAMFIVGALLCSGNKISQLAESALSEMGEKVNQDESADQNNKEEKKSEKQTKDDNKKEDDSDTTEEKSKDKNKQQSEHSSQEENNSQQQKEDAQEAFKTLSSLEDEFSHRHKTK